MAISARVKKGLIVFWSIFVAGVAMVALLFVLIVYGFIGYMPPIEELENPKDKYASIVLSSDNVLLGGYYNKRDNRIFVSYDEISTNMINALISTEDARFANHSGIDGWALMRVFFKTVLFQQKNAGGGSTITQQLAKLLYSPTAENLLERVLQKPIEWVIAIQLERYYTKEEIVGMYLNKFDFLNQAVGIKSAAWIYFGTTPDKLTVEQSAMLVGMCKNPSIFNPIRFPDRAKGRRNVVLGLMRDNDVIDRTTCDELQESELTVDYHKADHKEGLAPYFREYLRRVMTASKPSRSKYRGWQMQQFRDDSLAWASNPLYGWCNKNEKPDGSNYNLYVDGLKIYSTVNSRMQTYAEEAVREHVGLFLQPKFFAEKSRKSYAPFSSQTSQAQRDSILIRTVRQSDRYRRMKAAGASEAAIMKVFNTPTNMYVFSYRGTIDTVMTPMDSIKYQKHFLRSGMMAMDPRTGAVMAYVGGIDYRYFQYDMVTQGRRQVGSTIKPFLYTLAMENGFTPCDEVLNVSQRLVDEVGNVWEPRNVGAKRKGEMVTLQWGLANSNNWISAHLMSKLSPYAFVNLLYSFGINNKLQPVYSLALGSCEVSVEEMVGAYTAYPNLGERVSPLYVSRIEDATGNVIAEFTPRHTEVFSEESGVKMLSMLRAVLDGGTGSRVRYMFNLRAPMGGKTGTTNNNSDGWFIGFTPSIVVGTWVGGEERDIHFDTTADGQGAVIALPVFTKFMTKVYADTTLNFKANENFVIRGEYDPCGKSIQKVEPSKGIDSLFE